MRRKLSTAVLAMAISAVALPFAPGLVSAASAAPTNCPQPGVYLLVNPVVTTTPTGEKIASGGHFACVSLGSGVIGGSPLPACNAPGVLAVVDAVQVGDTIVQGTVLCVTLANAAGPVIGQVGTAGLLVAVLRALLGGIIPGGIPTVPTTPTVPTLPGGGGLPV